MLTNDLTLARLEQLRGRHVYARSGERIGRLEGVVYDDELGPGGWLAIRKGFLRRRTLLAPAGGVALREDGIRLRYPAPMLEASPRPRKNDAEATRRLLYEHYRLVYPGPATSNSPVPLPSRPPGRRPAGAVTLRSWLETTRERRYVALQRDHVSISRRAIYEPVEHADLGAQSISLTLFDQEPVVVTEIVAKERITMEKNPEPARERLPDPKKGEGDAAEEYRTPEDPAPEIGDKHDHHFAGGKRGNRQTA